jgi:hypothetical protein
MKPLYDQDGAKWHQYKPNYTPIEDRPFENRGTLMGLFLVLAPVAFIGAVLVLMYLMLH